MRMEQGEAWDLFRKWFTERSLIRCQGSFAMYAFSLKLRVLDLHPGEVRFMADDTQSEFVLKLSPELHYGYGDSRTVTGQEARDYECCLVVFFGEIPPVGAVDSLSFAEIRKPV